MFTIDSKENPLNAVPSDEHTTTTSAFHVSDRRTSAWPFEQLVQ